MGSVSSEILCSILTLEQSWINQAQLGRKKLLTMHGALHPLSKIDPFCIPRKQGGWGLQGIKETLK